MAGRKRRKLKSSAETTNKGKRKTLKDVKENTTLQCSFDLPIELLELILSNLNLKDNICSSAVCKRWYSTAISIRKANRAPWLLHFPKIGTSYELYDPARRKTYAVEYPEMIQCRICYTQDGWLLLNRPTTLSVFFFHPFTRKVIELPNFELSCQTVAFSCAPTNTNCVVFTLKHISPTVVTTSTCHPGATEWTTARHQNCFPFVSSVLNKIVFCNEVFYCLSLTGWVGIYNPKERNWHVLGVHPPKCPDSYYARNWWKGKFMAEHNGSIVVMYTCASANPVLFKLDSSNLSWKEMTSLDGSTLFVSFLSSQCRNDLTGILRNFVHFPKIRFFGKRCISYSLDENRYYPRKEFHDWGEQDPFENMWIDHPDELSAIFTECR